MITMKDINDTTIDITIYCDYCNVGYGGDDYKSHSEIRESVKAMGWHFLPQTQSDLCNDCVEGILHQKDIADNKPTQEQLEALWNCVVSWRDKQGFGSSETIYQSDLLVDVYDFMVDLCNIVGYTEYKDEEAD
jgi:hypothetical protein